LLREQDEYLVYRVVTHMPVPTLRRIVSRAEARVMPLDELPQAYAFARDLAQNRKDSIITDQVRTSSASMRVLTSLTMAFIPFPTCRLCTSPWTRARRWNC
jgi:hypothetical protein